ncbi:MAG: hypothetical protein LBJ64_06165 [Deltaproteobacteria bacterium]|jgi:hypothetical protein|nr:hypothetical protein [Deltaproteobacteria bacterium]
MKATININNLVEIRKKGLQALREALGPAGMVRFIQLFENGYGDYTKEKYQQPNQTVEEIDAILKNK